MIEGKIYLLTKAKKFEKLHTTVWRSFSW